MTSLAADRLRSLGVVDPAPTIIAKNRGLRLQIEAALSRASDVRQASNSESTEGQAATLAFTPRLKKSRGLRIRCPHCSNPIELLADAAVDSVNCTVCGSTFSLVDRSKETRLAQSLQKIDRFELISRLGIGGFGAVWKARDTELDRTVAVKIPRSGQLSVAETEQFLREARSAAQLRRPNIVAVHEVGRDGEHLFIVSDLIRGVSLRDYLTGNRLAPREAAELCGTIASALDHAHRHGVIHRDLKPANIMIDDSGAPHVMDFGLAKREAEEVAMTVDGQIVGTPAYMSPEQAGGRSAHADRRSDVYSLGVILFETVTGELPFRGNAQMQAYRRLNDEAPNIRSLNGRLPPDLATICAKCMEREPGRRYSTAKELADELRRFLDNVPIHARPISRPQRLVRWAGRRPLQAVVAGLVLFLAVAGPATALVIRRQSVRLNALVTEQGRLIEKREQENRAAMERSAGLQEQLKVWQGRAAPWSLWPPDRAQPPMRRQLASLLAARGDTLQASSDSEPEVVKAQRLLALAQLYESAGQRDDAERCLLGASGTLRDLRASRPRSTPIALALAESYERLSSLTAERDVDESKQWLVKGLAVRQSLANERPDDALLQAQRQTAELHSGAVVGFASAQAQLADVRKLDERLKVLWPTSPLEIYRVTCALAGHAPWLADEPSEVEGPSRDPATDEVTDSAD